MQDWIDNGTSGGLSEIIASICEPRFAAVMLEVVNRHLHVDHCSVMRLSSASVSQVFTNHTISKVPGASMAAVAYIDRYFRLDPNLQLVRNASRMRGRVVMRQQTPAQIENRAYRTVCYHECGIVQRVSLLTGGVGASLIALNFYRDRYSGEFSDVELERLAAASLPLAMTAGRHVELLTRMSSSANAWRQRLKVVRHDLSEREGEVAARMLAGDTMRDIGVALGIAHSSVVTYRERAYRRLGVQSLKELRRLFCDS
jgi:LuxR family transcriptional regulator, activator of tox operons